MSTASAPTNSQLRKEIFALALPIVWTNLLQRGVGIFDAVMVGHLGAVQLAAVGMAQLVVMLLTALPMGVGLGTMIIVANATGQKDQAKRCRAAATGIITGMITGLLLGMISYFLSYQFAVAMGAKEIVAREAEGYLKIMALFFATKAVIYITSYIFQGAGDSRTPLVVIFWVNISHIALAYPLIYGLSPDIAGIGLNPLGVRGAAIATVVTESAGAVVLLWQAVKAGLLDPHRCRVDMPDLRRIVDLGTPVFLERILTSSMQMVYARIVVSFSVAAYAAHQVGLNIESLSWLPGLAFAQAATAMVGQNIGARKPENARRVGYQSLLVALTFMSVLGLSYLLVPRLWVRLFTSDTEVIRYGVTYCYIVAFVQPPLASAMVFSGALRGAGATRTVMLTTILGAWVVRLPFAVVTGILLGGGIVWVWLAMVLDWSTRTAVLLWRYRREKFLHVA